MLIGLVGRARVGKGEAAKALAQEYNLHRAAFAGPLKEALLRWGLPHASLYGSQEEKERPLPEFGGASGRQFMQRLGMSMREADQDFWVKRFWSSLPDIDNRKPWPIGLVIDDVRMLNEVQSVRDRGGLVIKIERPRLGTADSSHVSETSVDLIDADVAIVNDGQLDDFLGRVLTAVEIWRTSKFIIDNGRQIEA